MGAPKNPRKKSPKKELTMPQKGHQAGKKNYFAKLMETEEGRALRKQWSTKPRKNGGRPKGTPDGYTLEAITPIRKQAKKDAERIVAKMAKENNIDDEYALEALRTAVEIMREPAQNRDRLTAARSHPLAKAAIVSSAIDDFARVALLRAFEKEHRLLATVDHIAQRRPRSKVTMTAESRN